MTQIINKGIRSVRGQRMKTELALKRENGEINDSGEKTGVEFTRYTASLVRHRWPHI